jgi:drug/metabolite transporter (DMT)-like permease
VTGLETQIHRKSHVDALGATALILFSILLGLNQALVKLVNAGMSPAFQVGLRSVCAFFIVLAVAVLLRKKLSVSDGSLIPGILSGLLFSLEFFLLFTALEYTTVARVSMLFYTQPFWVALGAHFLLPGERLNGMKVMGLVLAISGVVLLLANGDGASHPDTLIGDVMCIFASVSWAAIVLLVRRSKLSGCAPEMQLLYQLAVSGIILMALSPFLGDLVRDLNIGIILIFAFQVVVVVSMGFLLWFWALSIYPASDMASFGLLAPLFGVFFGWLIFDDELSIQFTVALGLVCAGILLNNRRQHNPVQSP